jgi:DnaJ-class molecular chaperone
MDYYQTLGINKSASAEEIKSAYRKQALEWHPDRNKDPKAATKFKEVTEAYEVLSDPQKKQMYDQYGSAAFNHGQHQGPFQYTYRSYGGGGQNPFEGINVDFGGFSDPFELFEQFFGGGLGNMYGGGGRSRQRRATYSLGLTFLEAANGAEKNVEIGGKETKIKIPAGVDDGTRVRFGDFDVIVSVWPDKIFKRDGLDIHVEVKVDFDQAILGTTVEVPTINGPVSLKIPPGTQPDAVIRLGGRGIRSPHSGRIGDEYVHISIKIPTKLTREQKESLENFHSSSKKRTGWF